MHHSALIVFSLLGTSVLATVGSREVLEERDVNRWAGYGNRWRRPTTASTPVQATTLATSSTVPTSFVTSALAAADPSTSATAQASQPSTPNPTGLSLTTPWLPNYETDSIPAITDQNFIDTILVNVNNMRKAHDAAPLTWSAEAANYAVAMEAKYPCQHTGGEDRNGYGENLCMNTGPHWIKTTGDSMQAWYDEWHNYTPADESTYMVWGHFSQLVWKSTTEIGCAWSQAADCSAGDQWHTIRCLFSPAGNVAGMYASEVTP